MSRIDPYGGYRYRGAVGFGACDSMGGESERMKDERRTCEMDQNDEKKRLCRGCRDDYYNQPGNSTTGECWMLNSAKLVTLTKVVVWQEPPYQWQPKQTLSCHHPEGSVWIDKDDPRLVENWKEPTNAK